MIEDVKIDSDERGFLLVLSGDFVEECEAYLASEVYDISFRLPQDMALRLLDQAKKEILPWASERAEAYAEYLAMKRQGFKWRGEWVPEDTDD